MLPMLLAMALASAGLCACAGSAPADAPAGQPGWHTETLRHGGLQRVFRYYRPADLPEGAPLVLLFHGATRSMSAMFRPRAGGTNAWPILADEAGFLLIAPNGTDAETGAPGSGGQVWNDCRASEGAAYGTSTAADVGFAEALIAWAARRFGVDRGRAYATGASNGGGMALRLARERSASVAAAASFIHNRPADDECGDPPGAAPVMLANGTADPFNPWVPGDEATRGETGRNRSAEETLDYWLRRNGLEASAPQVEELPDRDDGDGSRVIRRRYGAGAQEVLFYEVRGGGHVMPSVRYAVPRLARRLLGPQNRDVEGARLAWQFLRRHER